MVDEVVQIGADFADLADVVDGQVEFLEGEAAELAHDAGNEVIGCLRQRMSLRPRGIGSGDGFSVPRNPLASNRSAPDPRSVSECSVSPMTSRMPANDGSSQSTDGRPSLKNAENPLALDSVDADDRL